MWKAVKKETRKKFKFRQRCLGFQTRTAEAEFEIYGRDHMFVIRARR